MRPLPLALALLLSGCSSGTHDRTTDTTHARQDGESVALTLHGQTRPVTIKVVRDRDHYRGSASLKQTAFGITPITVAAGTVKVKDEVSIGFDVVTRSTSGSERRLP